MIIDAATTQQTVTFIQGILKILATFQLTSTKYPDQTCVFDGETYDYIIVGGGTAGCVLASRLVEDKTTSVLLIEAGGEPQIESDLAGLMVYPRTSPGIWDFILEDKGVYQETHKEINTDMPLGKSLGGSSGVTFSQYTPGSKHDYNDWSNIVNDSIWAWDNVLPYLKKSQRLEDSNLLKTDSEYFGQNGNIGLTLSRKVGPINADPYFKMFEEIGQTIVPSVNGNISLGVTDAIYTISKGMRQNTAFGYLGPKRNYKNLYVLKHTFVKKIIFDAYNNAKGVAAVICNKRHVIIKVKKEVILSAGVVNTPKILMLSGIGPKKELCKHKIHVLSDIPVGENLQNQLGVLVTHNATNKIVPYTPLSPYEFQAATVATYVALNKSNDYPDYQSYTYLSFPKICMLYCTYGYLYADSICNNYFSTSVNTHMMFTLIVKQKFKSRGKITLKSNYYGDAPLIFSSYYSAKEDITSHARAIQDFVRVEKSNTFKKFGGQYKDPSLPQCGKRGKSENLKYWECYVRYMTLSQHHYTSTCAMGTVVDSRLKVYGVKKLRVVDASVMPYVPTGGSLGATIMIAEKAADLITEDRFNSNS